VDLNPQAERSDDRTFSVVSSKILKWCRQILCTVE